MDANVRFKRKKKKPGPGGGVVFTYETYAAPTKKEALAFLESKDVVERGYCVVVETPEGVWGKRLLKGV